VLNFGRRIADAIHGVLRHPDSFPLSRERLMALLQINDLIVLYAR